jgi:CYTH domain-containing protein
MSDEKKELILKIDLSRYPELNGKKLNELFDPLTQFGKAIQESFQLMNQQFDPVLQLGKAIQESFQLMNQQFGKAVQGSFQLMNQLLAEFFKVLAEQSSKIPEATKKAYILLAEKGWYIPSLEYSIALHFDLANELVNGSEGIVDDKLCKIIEKDFSQLAKNIYTLYPHRSRILKAACNAHKRKEYSLSIPIFLAQADGICKERIGHDLFKKNRYKPETAKYVDKFSHDSFMAALLAPFGVVLPISYSENQRENKKISLNRHQILHGEVYDYDTEINSYKSFSLLSYICSVLEMAEGK